jgi:hypothetical protein
MLRIILINAFRKLNYRLRELGGKIVIRSIGCFLLCRAFEINRTYLTLYSTLFLQGIRSKFVFLILPHFHIIFLPF